MRVIEDPFSLPDDQFRLVTILASGFAASRYALAAQHFPGGGRTLPRSEKVSAPSRGNWTIEPAHKSNALMAELLPDAEPAHEKIASLFDPAKRMQLELTQFTTLYQSYLHRHPGVRLLILNQVEMDAMFPDPRMGFGLTFRNHEQAIEVTDLFVKGLPNRMQNFSLGELSEFRVDLMRQFWNRYFLSLEKCGFDIMKRETSKLGEGAWVGLSIVRLLEIFGSDFFDISVEDLRLNPLFFLKRHPLFRSWVQVGYLN